MRLGGRNSFGRFVLGQIRRVTAPAPTIPKKHGKDARIDFTLAGALTDVSVILSQVKVSRGAETFETTGKGDADPEFMKGKKSYEISFTGLYSASVDLADHLDSDITFDYYPGGRADPPKHSGEGALIADIDTSNKVDDMTAITGTLTFEEQTIT